MAITGPPQIMFHLQKTTVTLPPLPSPGTIYTLTGSSPATVTIPAGFNQISHNQWQWVQQQKRKPLPKHWYFVSINECPGCGRSETTRERRFTERPRDWKDRHDYEHVYDGCDY